MADKVNYSNILDIMDANHEELRYDSLPASSLGSQYDNKGSSFSNNKAFSFNAGHNFSENEPLLSSSSSERFSPKKVDVAMMFTFDYIGLYSQYAALGLLSGSYGLTLNFCVYVYDGPSNLCSNAGRIIFLLWR